MVGRSPPRMSSNGSSVSTCFLNWHWPVSRYASFSPTALFSDLLLGLPRTHLQTPPSSSWLFRPLRRYVAPPPPLPPPATTTTTTTTTIVAVATTRWSLCFGRRAEFRVLLFSLSTDWKETGLGVWKAVPQQRNRSCIFGIATCRVDKRGRT